MEKRNLGKTEIAVPPIGMGVLTIGPPQLALPVSDGAQVFRYAIENGIDFLDTAEYYKTYTYIRQAMDDLAPSFSQNTLPFPHISSKSLSRTYSGMRHAIDECRSALNMDQIDIFLLHEVCGPSDFENRLGAWECLIEAKAKGQVKAIGISTHHVDAASMAVEIPGVDIIFPLINHQGLGVRKGDGSGTKEEMAQAIKSAYERDIGVFAMKAFGGGHLVHEYKKSLDYVWNLPGIKSIMIGMGCKRDVDDALAWAAGILPDGYRPDLNNKKMFVERGDCSGCGACVSRCSSKAICLDEEGVACIDNSVCVLCGYCAPICPTRALIFL